MDVDKKILCEFNIHRVYDVEYRDYSNIPGSSDEENLSFLRSFLDWVKDDQPYQLIFLGGHFVGASLVFLKLHRLEGQDGGAIVFSPFHH